MSNTSKIYSSTQKKGKDIPLNVINDESIEKSRRNILKTPCKKIKFIDRNGQKILSKEDQKDLDKLLNKYNSLENCAGLAAPQIGIDKCMIIFGCEPTEEIKKARPDLIQEMPSGTIWINPSYEGIGDKMYKDVEGCFSINDTRMLVKRYYKISYEAYLPDGKKVEGTAEGFLARIIQHEIDHLAGVLCRDRVENNEKWTDEQYKKNRESILKLRGEC